MVMPGGPSGGVLRHFPFTYQSPNIATGFAVYTPTVGDELLDAWIEVDTAWNGTTPQADIGFGIASHQGLFGTTWGPVDLSTGADTTFDSSFLQNINSGNGPLSLANALRSAILGLHATGGASPFPLSAVNGIVMDGALRNVPGKFVAANPLKVWVTQNGQNNGAATGATQGAAVLYIVTATPH